MGEYGVASEARHRTAAPEPDASVPPSAPGQLEPMPERVVIPPNLAISPATARRSVRFLHCFLKVPKKKGRESSFL